MIKKIFFLWIIVLIFQSCNPLYKQYINMNSANVKKNNRYKNKIVKKILNEQDDQNSLLIISWENNIFDIKKMVFHAILYNNESKKISYIYNTREDQFKINVLIQPSEIFDDELYILKNYLSSNESYLLSLNDSFSNSDIGSYFYIYDFQKNKKIKINAIVLDKNGKVIQ